MAQVRMVTVRRVPAPPDDVYRLVADYQRRRDYLTDNFTDYAVEEGGQGAGTRMRYRLHAGRRVRDCRMSVSEPDPGRVIVEEDANSSLRTRWAVTAQGGRSSVEVEVTWDGAGGVAGFFESMFAPLGLRRIYDQVLDRLARVAARSS
ncbi:MAG: SRPBCC family protein [Streptosporangiaceae bacterium]